MTAAPSLVLCVVLAPYTVRRPDGSTATAGDRLILTEAEAQRLAELDVVAVIEAVG